jgi:hypothetical protein
MTEPLTSVAKAWEPLTAPERRVLGVLIEKQKTTPEYYPMSVAAITTGCNQKSNRDPTTAYDPDDVEETLHGLRRRGVALLVEGGGRVAKWKHTAYDWLGLRGRAAELAILAELLLRGPQTEAELRARASRMDEIDDLPTLQGMLASLKDMGLVVYLSPPGQKRGVMVTHGLYPAEELARLRDSAATGGSEAHAMRVEPAAGRPAWTDEADAIRAELADLRGVVHALADELRELKRSLGAADETNRE